MENTFRQSVLDGDASLAEQLAVVRGKTNDRVRLLEQAVTSYRADIEYLMTEIDHITRIAVMQADTSENLRATNDILRGLVRMYAPADETELSEPTQH